MNDNNGTVLDLCRRARHAAQRLSQIDDNTRSAALQAAATRLRRDAALIEERNRKDLGAGRAGGLSAALLDRLLLSRERIESMAAGLEAVAELPDPLLEPIRSWQAPSGLDIEQRRIPIGVIGVIYESRPNVTADVAALCVKSGNAVVLKGGKEAIASNSIIADLLAEELCSAGVPEDAVQLIRSTERSDTQAMLEAEEFIDVIIPRGGPGLVRAVAQHSNIPVIKHYEGVCHVYVDSAADLAMAADIAFNAKVQRPGVCNAMENLLVHESVAEEFFATIGPRFEEAGVEIRGDDKTCTLLPGARQAVEDDWSREYLDLIVAVKVVSSLDEAIDFVNHYGSGHSDSIVTVDEVAADKFLDRVDSAVVYVNASTRFTDGFAFGFGAEVGISTNRLHARGPMGLRELTTYKYVVRGQGQLR